MRERSQNLLCNRIRAYDMIFANSSCRSPPNTHAIVDKPPPYQAPPGFETRTIEDEDDESPKASQLFGSANTKGKQIWYIIAPASVPIASIKKMTLRDVKQRKSVVTHLGNDYGFVQDVSRENESTSIMLPSTADNGYRAGKNMQTPVYLQD